MVAQQIWYRRNKFVFEGVMGDPRCLLKCAIDSLEDFRIARRVVDPPSNRPLSQHSPSWSAPPNGWTKVNWDASLDVKQKVLGIGLIARDNLGQVKGSMCYARSIFLIHQLRKLLEQGWERNLVVGWGLIQFSWKGIVTPPFWDIRETRI
jgi:hypothetical protein